MHVFHFGTHATFSKKNLRNAKLIAGLSHSHFLRVKFVRACVPRHRSVEKHEVEKNNLYFLYEISSQRGATRIALLVKEETRMQLKLPQSWHMRLHRQICLVNAGSMLKLSRSRSHSSRQSCFRPLLQPVAFSGLVLPSDLWYVPRRIGCG